MSRCVRRAGVVSAAWILLGAARLAAVCPGCIEGSSSQVGMGYFWSIMFMMAVPFFVVGTVGGGIYWAYRQSMRREVEEFLADHEKELRVRDRVARRYG